jgi:GDP-L-fucose synthase
MNIEMNTKKILITGGSGLVGTAIKNISNNYLDKYEFIFIDSRECNLINYDETYKLFERYLPNYVIHLAANVGGLFKNINYKVEMLEKNLLINFNVVKCSHIFKVEKLIGCLSTCIFPDKTTYPINEKMLHNGPPHNSNDAYAYAKRMLEIHCNSYRENYGDNCVCIIPTNIYGNNDNYNLEDAHVIPALIHKCYLAKLNNEEFIVKGTGKPLRQFIYSYDLAKLIIWTLENYNDKSIILSVSEKDEVSIEYIAKLIAKAFNMEDKIKFDDSYSDGQFKKTADNSRLMSLLNEDFKFTSIEEGINKSVEWFINNYNNCRK